MLKVMKTYTRLCLLAQWGKAPMSFKPGAFHLILGYVQWEVQNVIL